MNSRLIPALSLGLVVVAFAGQPPRLGIHSDGAVPRIELASPGIAPVVGTRYQLRLQSSADLRIWQDEGDWEALVDADGRLRITPAPHRFYRVAGEVAPSEDGGDGADIFGYAPLFKEELARVGFLTPEEFAASLPDLGYRAALSFDPTTAQYWEAFNADPAVVNEGLKKGDPGYRNFDFRLNEAERERFLRNGFVVSERLGAPSFGEVYYRIFTDDLPVYVTADSALHAWHITFQRVLKELEEIQLAENLKQMMAALWNQLNTLPPALVNGPLAPSFRDADYLLTVANALLWGASQAQAVFPENQAAVEMTLAAIRDQKPIWDFPLFGEKRLFDFSQFKVRGHYEQSENLQRYFRGFMWLALADLRIWSVPPGSDASLRQLGTACVLAHLLSRAGQEPNYATLDQVIRLFVGRPDSLTATQLLTLLRAAGINSLNDLTNRTQLAALQQAVLEGGLGRQLYAGAPFPAEVTQLPASFTFLGQRFVPDGWALAQVTFNRIQWPTEIPGKTWHQRVLRRRASALDVAWSVLGNPHVGDLIAARMLADPGVPFRDGLPYAHNLEAVAGVFRRLEPAAWEDSLTTRWLYALRALSAPTTDARFPEATQTRAWTRRMLNTQLASYTELKHDTILYAKQPYAAYVSCFYPAGFVEPIPEFWQRMAAMAEAATEGLSQLEANGRVWVRQIPDLFVVEVSRAERRDAAAGHCRRFARVMRQLAGLAEKELRQEPFTEAEITFLRGLMNSQEHEYYGATYDGWYPRLFYNDYTRAGGFPSGVAGEVAPLCNEADPLVADIFTAPPDQIDLEGGVLHEGTGYVDLLLIAVDNGADRMVYAGPTASHYEVTTQGTARYTDSTWNPGQHTRPSWTENYLAPVESEAP